MIMPINPMAHVSRWQPPHHHRCLVSMLHLTVTLQAMPQEHWTEESTNRF